MITISDDTLHELKIKLRETVERERRLYKSQMDNGVSDTMLDDITHMFIWLASLNPDCDDCANDVKTAGEWAL